MKKIPGDIILYKSTINDNHMIYVPKICCMTDVVVIFLFGLFFVFLPPNSPKNENLKKKKKKNTLGYHHITQVYQKSW